MFPLRILIRFKIAKMLASYARAGGGVKPAKRGDGRREARRR
jgi:ribosomal protein L16 Arg81 hydroxylase